MADAPYGQIVIDFDNDPTGQLQQPGMWRWTHEAIDVKCLYGHVSVLGNDFDIDDFGNVTPSVECPAEGCDFHFHIRLVGWPGKKENNA